MFLFQTLPNKDSDYIEAFTHMDNPVFISLFLVFIIGIIIYTVISQVLRPIKQAHKIQTLELEKQKLQILAKFAEVSPDPLLRLDFNGNIHDANKAAKQLMKSEILGKSIEQIIPIKLNSSSLHGRLHHRNKDYSYFLKKFEADKIMLLYLRDITENVEYEKKIVDASNRAQDKVEAERQRIAEELHDGIGQNISIANVKLVNFVQKHSDDLLNPELKHISSILVKTIEELRHIAYDLKPRVLDEMGLAPALIALCTVSSTDTTKFQHEIKGNVTRLVKTVEATLYRITQEAINNITKHSKATDVRIQLKYETDKVKLTISDNGEGFDITAIGNKKDSLGLFNMKQRVTDLNGSLKIETAPGQGTIIFIEINTGKVNVR